MVKHIAYVDVINASRVSKTVEGIRTNLHKSEFRKGDSTL